MTLHSVLFSASSQMQPLRLAIYGSSLFLQVLAVSLARYAELDLIFLPSDSQQLDILCQDPAIILYQSGTRPPGFQALLRAGLRCAEINTQYSRVTLHQYQQPEKQIPTPHTADLVAAIVSKE